jgi:Tol biopolymer transport system component
MDALYDLDLLDLATGSITQLMTGLEDGLQIAWSPDGTTLAALTGIERSLRTDTWLVPVAGGRAQRIVLADDGSLSAVAWSPDGTRLAGLINRSDPESPTNRFEPVLIGLPNERLGADLDGSPLPTGLEDRAAPGT